jgi:hypothetical protein
MKGIQTSFQIEWPWDDLIKTFVDLVEEWAEPLRIAGHRNCLFETSRHRDWVYRLYLKPHMIGAECRNWPLTRSGLRVETFWNLTRLGLGVETETSHDLDWVWKLFIGYLTPWGLSVETVWNLTRLRLSVETFLETSRLGLSAETIGNLTRLGLSVKTLLETSHDWDWA